MDILSRYTRLIEPLKEALADVMDVSDILIQQQNNDTCLFIIRGVVESTNICIFSVPISVEALETTKQADVIGNITKLISDRIENGNRS